MQNSRPMYGQARSKYAINAILFAFRIFVVLLRSMLSPFKPNPDPVSKMNGKVFSAWSLHRGLLGVHKMFMGHILVLLDLVHFSKIQKW